MGTHKNHYDETIPMSTNNIGSNEKKTKVSLIINKYSILSSALFTCKSLLLKSM